MKLSHLQHLVKFRKQRAMVMKDVEMDSAWERAPGEWVIGISGVLKEL
jgi:hypothetical protein